MLSRFVQRVFTFACALTLLTACAGAEGPAGPPGPEGPQGPQGPQGPAGTSTSATFFVVMNATGYAEQGLPLAYGTDPGFPPTLNCYITENRASGVWLPVSDGVGDPATATVCGLLFDEGRWFALVIDGPPGWTAAFAVRAP